jgi:hypothetical protein
LGTAKLVADTWPAPTLPRGTPGHGGADGDAAAPGTRRPEPHQSTVEYSLTPLGQSLAGPLDALRRWSEEHEAVVEDARQRFDAARAAGKPAEVRIQT